MPRTPQQERLFTASGEFETTDALTVFLYHLMRDELPAGTVAQAVREATDTITVASTLTNGFLGRYAAFLADELRQASGPAGVNQTLTKFTEVLAGMGAPPESAPTAAADDAPDMTPTLGPGPHPERYDCPCAPCVGRWGAR